MMVERVGIIKNMEDQELEMLLGEIPHATSSVSLHHHRPSYANGHHHHHHHHHHVVNGNTLGNPSFVTPTTNRMMYGMYDDDSSSNYSRNTYTQPATAFPSMFVNGYSSSDTSPPPSSSTIPTLHDPIPNPHIGTRNPEENLIDELGRLYINQDRIDSSKFGPSDDYLAINPHFPRTPITPDTEIHPAFFGFQQNYGVVPSTQSSNFDRNETNYCYQWGIPAQFGKTNPKSKGNTNHGAHRFHHMAAAGSPKIRITCGGPSSSAMNDSLIIQGEDLSHIRSKRFENPCENGRLKYYLVLVVGGDSGGSRESVLGMIEKKASDLDFSYLFLKANSAVENFDEEELFPGFDEAPIGKNDLIVSAMESESIEGGKKLEFCELPI